MTADGRLPDIAGLLLALFGVEVDQARLSPWLSLLSVRAHTPPPPHGGQVAGIADAGRMPETPAGDTAES